MEICYIDEVGMSSIAGKIIVAAIVGKENSSPPLKGIRDSKEITKHGREELYPELIKLPHAVTTASIKEIMELNVFYARFVAMKRAVLKLVADGINIDKVIVDGKFTIPDLDIPQEAVIKADAKFWQTGAASIIAKVHRDNMMAKLAGTKQYSYYDWENNAGYYSPKHRDGIILHGPCDLHRTGFVYFKYCMERHIEFKEFVKQGGSPAEFFKKQADGKKSDYVIWKESKKGVWRPILPNLEKK